MSILLKLLPGLLSFLGKYLPGLALYLKGRADASAKRKAEGHEDYLRRIDIADDARADRLPDIADDPNNRNRRKN